MRPAHLALAFVLAGCARSPEATVPGTSAPRLLAVVPSSTTGADPIAIDPPAPDPIAYGAWKGFGFAGCSYIAPVAPFVQRNGAFDVVFHFHAGQMSDRDLRASALRGVFVSCGYGLGTSGYANAFTDPARFGRMLELVTRAIAKESGDTRATARHIGLVSWSAGFASIARILSVPRWYERVDSVVLLDSLHARYTDPNPHTPAQGKDHVDVRSLGTFVRYARDAAEGRKAMVITHSSIVPPDYASSSEATDALLDAVGVTKTPPADADRGPELGRATGTTQTERAMRLVSRADVGNLHVRGFEGRGASDHFDHLHLVGEVLRSWVVPRWHTPDRVVYTDRNVYTAPSEQR